MVEPPGSSGGAVECLERWGEMARAQRAQMGWCRESVEASLNITRTDTDQARGDALTIPGGKL